MSCIIYFIINKEVYIIILLSWIVNQIYSKDDTHMPTTNTNPPQYLQTPITQ